MREMLILRWPESKMRNRAGVAGDPGCPEWYDPHDLTSSKPHLHSMTIQGPSFSTRDFQVIDDPNYSSTYSIKQRCAQCLLYAKSVLHMEYVELRLLKIPVSILVPYSVTLGLEFLYEGILE